MSGDGLRPLATEYSWAGLVLLLVTMGYLVAGLVTDGGPMRSHPRARHAVTAVLVTGCLVTIGLRFALLAT